MERRRRCGEYNVEDATRNVSVLMAVVASARPESGGSGLLEDEQEVCCTGGGCSSSRAKVISMPLKLMDLSRTLPFI